MSYTVQYFAEAFDDLRDMPARYRQRVLDLISGLAKEPYPLRSKQLRDPLSHLRRLPLENGASSIRSTDADQEILIRRIKLKEGPETYEDLE